ncbi:unnamed protein product [Cunninghamella echinulata]
MKELKDELSISAQRSKPDMFYSLISKQKNKGFDDITFKEKHGHEFEHKDTAIIFSAYEKKLFDLSLVDFDGLQLHARELFKNYPQVLEFIEHVLVDEFQDTNELQYELLRYMTNGSKKSISVVGDPDQSIFGWRNADTRLFKRLELEYENTAIVNLQINYRSTKMIIASASHVVNKDKNRLNREMITDNHAGTPISVLKVSRDTMEAETVAEEIKRIVKYSRGLIRYKDIAILFRMNYLTFNFEQSLNAAQVPYVLVSGVRFLDRMEIKDILSYLSFFYNPKDSVSFERIINVPRRGLGEVSIKEILRLSHENQWNILQTIQKIVEKHPSIKSARLQSRGSNSLSKFWSLYLEVKKLIDDNKPVSDMLKLIVEKIDYHKHLKDNYENEYNTKLANVDELITFAHRKELQNQGPSNEVSSNEESQDKESQSSNKLAEFLELCTLCGDSKESEDASEGRVSLITMHAAKGLEWPCVFIAACEEGIIPMARNVNHAEESRVMYVGMTRAKCFLYCTHTATRQKWGNFEKPLITRYLYDLPEEAFQKKTPVWNAESRRWVASVLGEPPLEDDDDDDKEWIDLGDTYESSDQSDEDYGRYSDEDALLDYDTNPYGMNNRPKKINKLPPSSSQTYPLSTSNSFNGYNKRQFDTFQPSSQVPIKNHEYSSSSKLLHLSQNIKYKSLSSSLSSSSHLYSQSTSKPSNSFNNNKRQFDTFQSSSLVPIKNEYSSLKLQLNQNVKNEFVPLISSSSLPIKQEIKDKPLLLPIKQEHKKQKITTYKSSKNLRTSSTSASVIRSFEECVKAGIKRVASSKASFALDEVIIAAEDELKINKLTTSPSKTTNQCKQQLEILSDMGSLAIQRTRDITRYIVLE